MRSEQFEDILRARTRCADAIGEAAARRVRPAGLTDGRGRLLVIAADHPARAALRAGDQALAMGDRIDLLDRITVALSRPGVGGLLGTADIVEDLLLLGALEGKVVLGSMNRGGLAGTVFELDDRFTGYDAEAIAGMGYQGGKMLMRIDPDDPATVSTVESCAHAVSELASHRLMALIEPFISHRVGGRVHNDLSADAMVQAVSVAAGLGNTSAYTWLKIPVVPELERVTAATTLPALILGGDVSADRDATFAAWHKALRLPTVCGLVVGRNLLYPPDDDVAAAVDIAVGLL
jgi:hypothetical protein